jgi:signal transduction histidine kinase/ABC-type multidrug transport system ATPase subunit
MGLIDTATRMGTQAVAGEPVVSMLNVSKSFGPRRVLHSVDLTVQRGELLALVGENGAGKSTLVGCLAGSLPPDHGRITVSGMSPAEAFRQGRLAVVRQDLGLCDSMTVTANLFLGRERGWPFLSRRAMQAEAEQLFSKLGLDPGDLRRKVGELSGGQRQVVALARGLLGRPDVLVLDEPTAALGVSETERVERLLRQFRADGIAIVLVSHRIEQIFGLADRIAVLRFGEVVADVSTVEAHPDDVVALMSGMQIDSAARRHLERLCGLVDQLAEVEASASIPTIVSAITTAFGQQQLCVHLRTADDCLSLSASVGMGSHVLKALETVLWGRSGGSIGDAAEAEVPVVVEDIRSAGYPILWDWGGELVSPVSSWSVPILGKAGVIGVLSGFADAPGRPQPEQIQLVAVYASLASTSIERERLLDEFSRRNHLLETLRSMLDTMAGSAPLRSGMQLAVEALARGLRADRVFLVVPATGAGEGGVVAMALVDFTTGLAVDCVSPEDTNLIDALGAAAEPAWRTGAREFDASTAVVPVELDERRFLLAARWSDASALTSDALGLLEDAARSLRLAIEREVALDAQAEAAALRRTRDLQREFVHRLSHELRTPLTAIQGFASTLRQTDVEWDETSKKRFLDSIATESARMGRLVGDLLDASAIDAGVLRLQPDWCDVRSLIDAALSLVHGDSSEVVVQVEDGLVVWADHDRLEQVFVNLIDNALRHGAGDVNIRAARQDHALLVDVTDHGAGIAVDQERVFDPYVRGDSAAKGAGLGLAIVRGIVVAHGGHIEVLPEPVGAHVRFSLPIEHLSPPAI